MRSKKAWAILRDGKIFSIRMSRSYANELADYFTHKHKRSTFTVKRAKIVVGK